MQDKITKIIFESLKNLSDELDNPNLANPTLDTPIYGINGNLDSLALVSFIADLEERFNDELNLSIILADQRAMSLRNSPFRDVQTLLQYIDSLIDKE
ncbi:hypothetical protein CCY99_09105 [Helicobacter sp. 16-1353]|uniref:hypothetical protein n=1 Tax=Helicobacter sp. 16-1353 TaxID=2004996 RepID=UPI000DCF33D9|nr:hypothetical protein [Helicobacter sp. 16-1353]RAX51428.1 hypothetical protein CCY99_09105 [Helicobacter sp. 16-1353]